MRKMYVKCLALYKWSINGSFCFWMKSLKAGQHFWQETKQSIWIRVVITKEDTLKTKAEKSTFDISQNRTAIDPWEMGNKRDKPYDGPADWLESF